MYDLETDVIIGMAGVETVQEASNIVAASLQALHGAASICFFYDCWNPAAMPGDSQYSINTAIEEFIAARWNNGWYVDICSHPRADTVTRISRIAQYAWNQAYDAAKGPEDDDGPLSQMRSPRMHYANMNIVYDAERRLNEILGILSSRMSPNDEITIVGVPGTQWHAEQTDRQTGRLPAKTR